MCVCVSAACVFVVVGLRDLVDSFIWGLELDASEGGGVDLLCDQAARWPQNEATSRKL